MLVVSHRDGGMLKRILEWSVVLVQQVDIEELIPRCIVGYQSRKFDSRAAADIQNLVGVFAVRLTLGHVRMNGVDRQFHSRADTRPKAMRKILLENGVIERWRFDRRMGIVSIEHDLVVAGIPQWLDIGSLEDGRAHSDASSRRSAFKRSPLK